MKEYKSVLPKLSLVYEPSELNNVKITGSSDGIKFIRNFFSDDINLYESFFLLLLNNNHRTIGYVKISQGGITGTVVDIRIILKYVIESLATAIIVAHNHPSGNIKPSEIDKELTIKIKNALELIDVKILDHLIITPSNGYFSFADEGLI